MVYNNFLINAISILPGYLTRSYYLFKSHIAWSTGLHEAVNAGDLDQVRCLLDDYWVHVDSVIDPNHDTAIMLAAEKGHSEIVKCLVAHGASLKLPLKERQTILFPAVNHRHHALVEYLLKECGLASSVSDKNDESKTVVDIAQENADIDMLKLLEKYGASVTSNNYEEASRKKVSADANKAQAAKDCQMAQQAIEVLQAFRPHQFKQALIREESSEDMLESVLSYFFGPRGQVAKPIPKINLRAVFYEAVKSGDLALTERMLELDYYDEDFIANTRYVINFPDELKRKFPKQEQLFKEYIKYKRCKCSACGGKDWVEKEVQQKFPIIFQAVINNDKATVEGLMRHGATDESISLSDIADYMFEKYRVDAIRPSELAKQLRFDDIANIIENKTASYKRLSRASK